MKRNLFAAIVLIATLLWSSAGSATAQGGIVITDLGTLGGNYSGVVGINENGQIAGNSFTAAGELHAFLWEDGQMIDLGTLGGSESIAVDINNLGQIVGMSTTTSGEQHVFLWEDGAMSGLGIEGRAAGINDQTQIIGTCLTSAGERAFLWQDGVLTEIGTLDGYHISTVDINELGQVTGQGDIPDPDEEDWDMEHAFLWENGVLTDVGTLNNGTHSWAYAINDLGQIVGLSEHVWYSGQWGFLWDDGQMIDLGTLGGASAFPQDINNQGQIAGASTTVPLYQMHHAFLWQNGVMTDLGTLGGERSFAMDINERGQIVGRGDTSDGDPRAFLWENGVMKDLGTLDGYCCSWAVEMNEQGQIIGSSYDDPGAEIGWVRIGRATLWTIADTISISIDIRPGSATNPINLRSKGVVPVAVLTTEDFNALDLDPHTVEFAGAPPVKWINKDVDSDGDVDVLFHFPVRKLNLTHSSTQASLIGRTYQGVVVEGVDTVTIVSKK